MEDHFSYFTSECVSPGHPDKIADQISDAVLDSCLEGDHNSRVACEVFCTKDQVIVAGEISTKASVDVQKIVRNKIDEIGYREEMGFSSKCQILNLIHRQSPDIAMGVDTGGAGDQGIMFGGAVKETPELMPLSLVLSREIIILLTNLMRSGDFPWARPDAKSQVTLAYNNIDKIHHVESVVVSVQHNEHIRQDEIYNNVKKHVIYPVLQRYSLDPEHVRNFYINPTGRFVIGGPPGDTGLTGRKIIVDTYGGYFRHGGGAFSGKDSSKVDRSAAYAARWVAKNVVAADVAEKCEVQISYAIGVDHPLSVKVDTFGTSNIPDQYLSDIIKRVFDLSPKGIEASLQLRFPSFRYQDLAAFGHMGRTDISLPWEQTNKVKEIISLKNSGLV